MLDRELKKGSAELIILSIVEPRARHGYEISKLIEQRSAGQMRFHVASLYPLLSTFVLVAVVLLLTAAASTIGPAWRAARIDPAVALRSE
jgi:ABC-type lipoprotein release transport system permease subunit